MRGLCPSSVEELYEKRISDLDAKAVALAAKQGVGGGAGNSYVASETRTEALYIMRCGDSLTPRDAETVVRARVGKCGESALHRFGGVLHLLLYPLTFMLAVVGFARISCMSSPWSARSRRASALASCWSCTVFCLALPFAVLIVMLLAPLDWFQLVVRPCLSPAKKREMSLWPFPSSVAFWVAGLAGYMPAVLAHMLLGAAPSDQGVLIGPSNGSVLALRAAVVCDPHFMAEPRYLRAGALKGVNLLYAPLGGSEEAVRNMPLAVQWAFLLGDIALCQTWEAEAVRPPPPKSATGLAGTSKSMVSFPHIPPLPHGP